jgi:hypothetical protein
MAINQGQIATFGMYAWYPLHIQIGRELKQPRLHGLPADFQVPVTRQNRPGWCIAAPILSRMREFQVPGI